MTDGCVDTSTITQGTKEKLVVDVESAASAKPVLKPADARAYHDDSAAVSSRDTPDAAIH